MFTQGDFTDRGTSIEAVNGSSVCIVALSNVLFSNSLP